MAYSSTVPAAGSSLGSTRSQIVENFATIQTAFEIDHIDYDATGEGKHDKVTMPEKASGPTTIASEGAIYTKDTGGRPELFYRSESDDTETQLTGTDFIATANGQSTLPGGLEIKWGTATTTKTQAFGYVADFSLTAFASNTFSLVATSKGAQSTIHTTLVSATGFTLNSSSNNPRTVDWIAIGI